MDQASAASGQQGDATPIFGAFRRGYDPDQVDRYVADQQRRLDESVQRASEAERKLAAAVGQLRELHRRVAVLESEERSPQPTPLDNLGERVQRILQEAWEGAYALRQGTEQEMAELRERTAGEAEAIIVAARQRARAIEDEIERRRNAMLDQVEQDRTRAVAQITHLHHERDAAVGELLKVKAVIEATVTDISSRPRAVKDLPTPDQAIVRVDPLATDPLAVEVSAVDIAVVDAPTADETAFASQATASEALDIPEPATRRPRASRSDGARAASSSRRGSVSVADDDLPPTMQVHRLEAATPAEPAPDSSELVRIHRSASPVLDDFASDALANEVVGPAVFDFEEQPD